MAESSTVELKVGMTCGGCSGAVQRVLGKLEGVTNVDTDIDTKKVVVTGSVTQEQCLAALKPWSEAAGKSIGPWE